MEKVQLKIITKLCPLYLVASEQGLHVIHWSKQAAIPMATSKHTQQNLILQKTEVQLHEYFAGKRKRFELPLLAEGTEFQKQVWRELSKIPYGETRSYKDVAVAIKNEKACRAVGAANGRNPIAIVVPCHRVIAADGTLCGFGGGVENKKKLLNLEH